jgi:DNA (cytosine-5)-methyltransferase 3A
VNVLSLFDGISCGQLALQRAGISYDKYYSSEVDKYAIQITQKNFPETIQLGDVKSWREWDLPKIDLLMGGSPCQGFSYAGTGLNFEDPRSALFFDFVDILQSGIAPGWWLLENVKMKKEWVEIINHYLKGVQPTEINSALVSAQNRKRLYWTNIPDRGLPSDKGILLKDILFKDVLDISLSNVYGGWKEVYPRVHQSDKSPTIRTSAGGGHIPSLLLSDKALEYMNRKTRNGRTHWDFAHYSNASHTKSRAVVANFYKGVPYNVLKQNDLARKFHPIECERLQTLPDNYTEGVSNTQRYKMIGNGWTVDVIVHILKGIKNGND